MGAGHRFRSVVRTDPPDRYVNRAETAGSLRRGLGLLSYLGQSQGPLGLTELAILSGLDKATVHRLARALVDCGYLTQDPATRAYSLGLRILDLGFATLARLDVRQLALPYMRALAEQFDRASVSLCVLDGRDAVYIERISQRRTSVNVHVQVGSRIPAHCGSMGKAMLAALPVAESGALLRAQPLDAWTPRTLTSPSALEAQLEDVRTSGYAVNDEETALGLRSLAASVRRFDGRPAAAVNVAVAVAEMSLPELVEAAAPAVVEAAARISRHLGQPVAQDGLPASPTRTGATAR